MRIAVDAMGTDSHPGPEIEAAITASERWVEPVILVGARETLETSLAKRGVSEERVEVVDAPEVVKMKDRPADAARGKPTSSMAVGMQLVRDGEADAFVTCGNTGGALANAILRLGRMKGVRRPGLAASFPVKDGQAFVLDIGANTDCKPDYLVQFAALGVVYCERVLGIRQPRVGLLSNGEEPGKGSELIQETYPLLQQSGLNFIGNVEPKEAYGGEADVVVTDGFAGNIFLKTSEAVAAFMVQIIRQELRGTLVSGLGGLLAKGAFRRVMDILEPERYGAGPLLGVRGLVFIGHGRYGPMGVESAIRVAREAVASDLMQGLEVAIEKQLANMTAIVSED
jgi:glycerol-3-phosphate acyltransferase PlsX